MVHAMTTRTIYQDHAAEQHREPYHTGVAFASASFQEGPTTMTMAASNTTTTTATATLTINDSHEDEDDVVVRDRAKRPATAQVTSGGVSI